MSVEINYFGNCGNNLFQYCSSLIYCKKHNLKLITKPSNKILDIFQINFNGENNNNNNKLNNKIINSSDYDKDNEIIYYGEKNYIFNDYFQNTEYINNNFIHLLQCIKPINYQCNIEYSINDNDILCILRMGDFLHSGHNSEIVHPDYFLNILEKNNSDRVFFLIHPYNDIYIEKYLKFFKDYNIILLDSNRNGLFDFNITNKFSKIAFTNSTFNWWSGFFCKNIESKTLYTPKLMGYLGIGEYFRCHGNHIKNLWNIRNLSIPVDNRFINIKE